MVRLTTCGDAFEARLLAARLGSEGVVWSLRGGHDGPFAIGEVEVLVDENDLTTARELLSLDDFDRPFAAEDAEPERETTGRDLLVLVAVVVGVIVFAIARMGAKI
jgi:Putative prokaryotic signal transducing protein